MTRTLESITKHIGALPQMKSQTMKAIRIHNYGGPEVLQYEDAPRPQPQAGAGLLRAPAGGGNPQELKVCGGNMKDIRPHKNSLILCWGVFGVGEETR